MIPKHNLFPQRLSGAQNEVVHDSQDNLHLLLSSNQNKGRKLYCLGGCTLSLYFLMQLCKRKHRQM